VIALAAVLLAAAATAIGSLALMQLAASVRRPLEHKLAAAARVALASVESALRPLRMAGDRGLAPTDKERLRLQALAGAVGVVGGLFLAGLAGALLGGLSGSWVGARALIWRRDGYRRRVDAGSSSAALALADALSAGHSVRAALIAAGGGLQGAVGHELRRVGRELETGEHLDTALDGLRRRCRSRRIDLIVAAVRIQRRSGGSLATLLRGIAVTIDEGDRAEDEARSASAQARFTSAVVLALPLFGLLLAELAAPGFAGRLTGSPVAFSLLACAAVLQLAGVVIVRRMSRIEQ
jgi:tight adherence protein B